MRHPSEQRGSSALALVGANGVVRELEVVSAAREQAERTLPLALLVGRLREAPAQHLDRRPELVVALLAGQGGGDVLALDAQLEQSPLDALAPPRVEPP